LFSWFADADNFLGATRKAYSDLFSIPSRYILPIQMRKAAVQRVQKYGGAVESGTLTRTENTKLIVGELPMFHDGKNWIAGTNRIITYLSKTGYNADEELSKEELSKSVAYSALIDESLVDAI
ncbi:hypothetical protein BGX28_002023, partial [Mortierella sp. GBA30]